ncbi:hypothetical protein HK101_008373 [Irineochytrium annulatum]|nr:hypothetical protein HK101_008373 [Irineochytrium annulatum]
MDALHDLAGSVGDSTGADTRRASPPRPPRRVRSISAAPAPLSQDRGSSDSNAKLADVTAVMAWKLTSTTNTISPSSVSYFFAGSSQPPPPGDCTASASSLERALGQQPALSINRLFRPNASTSEDAPVHHAIAVHDVDTSAKSSAAALADATQSAEDASQRRGRATMVRLKSEGHLKSLQNGPAAPESIASMSEAVLRSRSNMGPDMPPAGASVNQQRPSSGPAALGFRDSSTIKASVWTGINESLKPMPPESGRPQSSSAAVTGRSAVKALMPKRREGRDADNDRDARMNFWLGMWLSLVFLSIYVSTAGITFRAMAELNWPFEPIPDVCQKEETELCRNSMIAY